MKSWSGKRNWAAYIDRRGALLGPSTKFQGQSVAEVSLIISFLCPFSRTVTFPKLATFKPYSIYMLKL